MVFSDTFHIALPVTRTSLSLVYIGTMRNACKSFSANSCLNVCDDILEFGYAALKSMQEFTSACYQAKWQLAKYYVVSFRAIASPGFQLSFSFAFIYRLQLLLAF